MNTYYLIKSTTCVAISMQRFDKDQRPVSLIWRGPAVGLLCEWIFEFIAIILICSLWNIGQILSCWTSLSFQR